MNSINRLKKGLLCNTSGRPIAVLLMVDSLYHYIPKKPYAPPLGESTSHAVWRFLSLERSMRAKDEFEAFDFVMQEYFHMKLAELVPTADLEKPTHTAFYLPMHAVKKESSTTTKIRAVFDASAKSSSNVSLIKIFLVSPTVHCCPIDVLLRFRLSSNRIDCQCK